MKLHGITSQGIVILTIFWPAQKDSILCFASSLFARAAAAAVTTICRRSIEGAEGAWRPAGYVQPHIEVHWASQDGDGRYFWDCQVFLWTFVQIRKFSHICLASHILTPLSFVPFRAVYFYLRQWHSAFEGSLMSHFLRSLEKPQNGAYTFCVSWDKELLVTGHVCCNTEC